MLQTAIDNMPGKIGMAEQFSQCYWEWEQQVSKLLEQAGYTDVYWWTSDGDSWGPLVRSVKATFQGTKYMASYG